MSADSVRQHETCAECGMPIEDGLTPLGRQYWQHTSIRIGQDDGNVPGTWTSTGTHWLPDHPVPTPIVANDLAATEEPQEFTVTWAMEVNAFTHREAAEKALHVLRKSDPKNIGLVFSVTNGDTEHAVDLSPGAGTEDVDLSTDR